MIKIFISLPAKALHRRALAAVKHTDLQKRFICVYTHFAAKRVDFTDNLTFCSSADGRIARHKGYAVKI